ncbi:glycosyltransferase [Paenibacillus sp. WLX1005]|uniref:glycosyltransferase n=1 Tax=Paenibacillus sp. WLX1005 TaxID=3243766 RepID=UPI0039840172
MTAQPMKTSIVILTYNQLNYTKVCIDSIRKFTTPGSYELIVVDNLSTDGTRDWLAEQTDIMTIFNSQNEGFPKGCNQGIAIATGDNVLLLNNDVIVAPEWLDNLLTCLYSDESIGAVGPVTNNSANHQMIPVPYDSIEDMLQFAISMNVSNPDKWEERIKLVGLCMLIKREVIDQIGVLDEIFTPGNFEDSDYSFRILQAGYKMMVCRDTFIHHFGSVSFKARPGNSYTDVMNINQEKFRQKWGFHSGYATQINYTLIKKINTHADAELKVLELGCGCGATLLEIKNQYPNAELHGVDINKAAIAIASHFSNAVVGDIEKDLDYPEKYFDYILLPNVLEYVTNPYALISDIRKYVKSDGMILAKVHNGMFYEDVIDFINGQYKPEYIGYAHQVPLHHFSHVELRNLFNKANYKNVECIGEVSQPLTDEQQAQIDKIAEISIHDPSTKRQYEVENYIVSGQTIVQSSLDELVPQSDEFVISMVNLLLANEIHMDDLIAYIDGNKIITEDRSVLYNHLAIELYNNEKYDLVLPLFQNGLKWNEANEELLSNMGIMLYNFGEKKLAVHYLAQIKNPDLDIQNLMMDIRQELHGE